MNFKKTISCFAAVIMIFSACPVSFALSAQTLSQGGVIYEIDSANGTASAVGVESGVSEISVLSEVSGNRVVEISADFAKGNKNLTLLDMSNAENLETIGNNAFSGCVNLEEVTFPANSLSEIGNSAFYNCTSLEAVSDASAQTEISKFGSSVFSLTPYLTENTAEFITFGNVLVKYNGNDKSVDIPSGVSVIADAFFDKGIEEVNLDGVTYIGNNAFYLCTSLAEAVLPEELEEIGELAFSSCTSLTKVSYGNSLSGVGYGAFMNCKNLSEFVYEGSGISALTEVGDCAFWNCSKLSLADFGELENVNIGTFWNCFNEGTDKTYFRVPASVKNIAEGGYGNLEFQYVTLTDSVENIAEGAFGAANNSVYVAASGSSAEKFFENSDYKFRNYGDVDGDGTLESSDISRLTAILTDGVSEDISGARIAADYDNDGKITMYDLMKIMKSLISKLS